MWDIPALAKRNPRFPDLTSFGPDFYSLHRANGDAVHVGANANRTLSFPPEKLMGPGFLAAIHVQDRVAVAKAFHDCLADGCSQKTQFRILTTAQDAGQPVLRWFEIRCEPAPKALVTGEGVLALAVTRDISERRRLEEELRRQQEKAESASIAKSRFLANMSHELRTPLNAILGFSELLNSDAMPEMPPERQREYVSLIHSSAAHLLTLVNDILDMSKIEAGKYDIVLEPFDFGQTIRGICAMLRGQADQKNINLRVGVADDLPEVTADQRAVRQIAINLISNAIKFTDEGGHVEVHARRVGREIELTVSDNGIGISSEHIGSLGQPFYQADSRYDRKYEGSGLGLSVVCGLVELHGGEVKFSSRKDHGTRVTVELPIQPADAGPVPAPESMEVLRLRERQSPRKIGGQAETRKSAEAGR